MCVFLYYLLTSLLRYASRLLVISLLALFFTPPPPPPCLLSPTMLLSPHYSPLLPLLCRQPSSRKFLLASPPSENDCSCWRNHWSYPGTSGTRFGLMLIIYGSRTKSASTMTLVLYNTSADNTRRRPGSRRASRRQRISREAIGCDMKFKAAISPFSVTATRTGKCESHCHDLESVDRQKKNSGIMALAAGQVSQG